MLGIALIDKPAGISSHDAVYRLRRALGIKKIGHSGTLDPIATGLLVMAVGDATRFLPYIETEPKVYEGVARLGVTTTTQDSEGEVVSKRPVGELDLEAQLPKFIGSIAQVPPMYSAVKVGGERLYKVARRGETVDRVPRTIQVHSFEAEQDAEDLRFRVRCGTGTYVRTLLHDLGEALGVGAHLTELRRVQSGPFKVAEANDPEQATEKDLIALEQALSPMPMVRLPVEATNRARHGNEFSYAAEVPGRHLGLLDDDGLFAVAVEVQSGLWRPERVLPA